MISSNIPTAEQYEWTIRSIKGQIEYWQKAGATNEVARLQESLKYQEDALVAHNAKFTPEAIAERNEQHKATIAQLEAAIKAFPAQAATLRKTLKAMKRGI